MFFLFVSLFYKGASELWLAKSLLFASINIYLYFSEHYKKLNDEYQIGSRDISTILLVSLTIIFPIIFYVTTGFYTITYYILLGYSVFYYFIAAISVNINEIINIIIKRNKHEDK